MLENLKTLDKNKIFIFYIVDWQGVFLNDNQNNIIELQNHKLNEQFMLINQLDDDEKNALFKIINSMLTKKRMKDLLEGKVGV